MARFHFQLEGVLTHRKNIEQQRQRDLALLQAQMRKLEDALGQMDISVKEATDELRRNHLVGVIDLPYLTAHRRFVASMQRQAVTLAQKMALLQRQIDQSRQVLAEAAKQRKIIEKLREHQLDRWRTHLDRLEREETDEIGMQLSYRQLASERQEVQAGVVA